MPAAGDDLVTIRELDDPVTAEMLCEALCSAGIPASAQGAHHRSMLGFTGAFIQVRIMVPASRERDALEVLEALESTGSGIDDPDAPVELGERPALPAGAPVGPARGPYRDRPREEAAPKPAPRLRRVAIVAALCVPGGANFYAHHNVLGMTLLAGIVASVAARGGAALVVALPLTIVADLVTGLGSVKRHNDDQIASAGWQLVVGLGIWVAVTTTTLLVTSAGG